MSTTLKGYDLVNVAPGTTIIPGSSLVKIHEEDLAIGTHTLYTVPTGKRAFLASAAHFNASGGTVNYYYTASISSTDYKISNTTAVSTGAAGTSIGGIFILEEGESLKIVTTTNNNLNVFGRIVEFSNTSGIKTATLISGASGDNTLYTCPASKTATVFTSTMAGFMETAGLLYTISNVTGGGIDHYANIVESGGSPGSTNQIVISSTASAGTIVNSGAGNMALAAGDFININLSAANTSGLIWSNVIEFSS